MVSDHGGEQNQTWEIYSTHRKSLEEIRVQQINTFDKAILTMSSSALGLSIVLISSFAVSGKLVGIPYLFISWVLFVATITANLFSYSTSAFGAERIMEKMDEAMTRGELYTEKSGFWVACTHILNRSTIVTFAAGAVFLLLFAFQNARALESKPAEPSKSPIENKASPTDTPGDPYPSGYTPIKPPIPRPPSGKPVSENPENMPTPTGEVPHE